MNTTDWGSAAPEEGEVAWFGGLRIERTREAPEGEGLSIPAGAAFGSGFHASTTLLLEVLAERDLPEAVLDVGCGSGVLGLAALRLGATRAVGVEIDEAARTEAAANAQLNGLQDRFELRASVPEDTRFALVLANILASELAELADVLGRRLDSGGSLWLSGIAETRLLEVETAYRQRGYRVLPARVKDGWCALEVLPPW